MVQIVQTEEQNGQQQDKHEWESARASFEKTPNCESPATTGKMMQHQDSETAHGEADPIDESKQIRLEKMIWLSNVTVNCGRNTY